MGERRRATPNTHVNVTVKQGEGSIMVWGPIASQGVGRIVRIDGYLTQYRFNDLLDEHLFKSIEEAQLEPRKVTFAQDHDP